MAVDVKDLVKYLYEQGYIRKYNDHSTKNIQICCPKPHYRFNEDTLTYEKHYERRPSLGIRISDGVFNCFSCGYRGSIEELVSELMGTDLYNAIKFLSARYDFDEDYRRKMKKEVTILSGYDDSLPKAEKPQEIKESEYQRFLVSDGGYFERRGYRKDILEKYEFGYDANQKRAVFPIRDLNGGLIGMIGRDVTNESPVKFLVYNYNANDEVEGWDRGCVVHFSRPRMHDKVLVVESGQDVPWGDQIGLTDVVDVASILGSKMTMRQAEILSAYDEVILALDNDFAGQVGIQHAVELLNGRSLVTVARYPQGRKDLGDCNHEEAMKMLAERKTPVSNLVASLRMMTT